MASVPPSCCNGRQNNIALSLELVWDASLSERDNRSERKEGGCVFGGGQLLIVCQCTLGQGGGVAAKNSCCQWREFCLCWEASAGGEDDSFLPDSNRNGIRKSYGDYSDNRCIFFPTKKKKIYVEAMSLIRIL